MSELLVSIPSFAFDQSLSIVEFVVITLPLTAHVCHQTNNSVL
jgi:hypothetical protein